MKLYKIIFCLMIVFLLRADEQTGVFIIDTIEAVVFGKEDKEIVTKSDLDRLGLSGEIRTLDDIIFEKEVLLDAKQHKIESDEETVDAYITQVQRENNLSQKDLENIFSASGYSFEEGRAQLQMLQTVNTMLDVKIRSNLIVPRKDVELYYNEHPEIVEATYTLQRVVIPFSKRLSRAEQRASLTRLIIKGNDIKQAPWSDPFTVNHSDIATNKQFIYDLKPGQISFPQEIEDGFELFKLLEKTAEYRKSLEEMYRDIVDILRRPKYEELMEAYRKDLGQQMSVIYF